MKETRTAYIGVGVFFTTQHDTIIKYLNEINNAETIFVNFNRKRCIVWRVWKQTVLA